MPTAFNFDTKNIILRTKDFKKHRLRFDPLFSTVIADSSDTDMGFQVVNANLKGIYSPRMIVNHKESTNFWSLINKSKSRGELAYKLSKKWHLTNEFIDASQKNLLRLSVLRQVPIEWQRYLHGYKQSSIHKMTAFIALKILERVYLQGYCTSEENDQTD